MKFIPFFMKIDKFGSKVNMGKYSGECITKYSGDYITKNSGDCITKTVVIV